MATIAELTADLVLYKTARDAILAGAQSYTINGRTLTRASLDTIIKEIARIDTRLATLNRTNKGGVKSPLFGTQP